MKWLIRLIKLAVVMAIVGGATLISAYLYVEPNLPSTENLRDIQLQVPLRVYSRDHKLIAEFGEKRRIPLIYDELPPRVIEAFLAAEDDRFFEHPGVDYQGLVRAVIEMLRTGQRRQGGSTITMQVARNFYLSPEKTITRKLTEILLSFRIERELSKQEILELYLNKIYLGNRAYGVGAAAQVYYGKDVDDLSLPQIAMIAGLPKAPSRFNPVADPERARVRRDYVLGRMLKLGFITEDEHKMAVDAPITAEIHSPEIEVEAPYVAEMVRSEMIERYGEEAAYTAGLDVYTTIDSRLQTTANAALRDALQAYDQRHGWRGAERQIDLDVVTDPSQWDGLLAEQGRVGDLPPALVTGVADDALALYVGNGETRQIGWGGLKWARRYINFNAQGGTPRKAGEVAKPGDIVRIREEIDDKGEHHLRIAEVPAVQGALVSLDPDDGAMRALVGGYDFYHSNFNRAIQAQRQPGSGFKAVIYSAALESGFTPATLVNDAPVVVEDASLEGDWRPENYSGKFFGPTRLRYALSQSRNLVSIRVLQTIGVDAALKHAVNFGFEPGQLPPNLSLALGSAVVAPVQMARAYSVLANGGFLIDPWFVDRIENDRFDVLFQSTPKQACPECEETTANVDPTAGGTIPAPRTLSPQNWYLMNSMLRDVVTMGTATRAKVLGRHDLAGKTGTTNDQRDAWFNGFNRHLVAVVWVGFDDNSKLGRGEVGGRAALPAWIDFMRVALDGVPEEPLEMPPGIVQLRIDPDTGQRAAPGQANAIFEVFKADNVPVERPLEMIQPVAGDSSPTNTATPGEIF